MNFNPSSSTTQSVSAGYYSGGTLSTANAYSAGEAAGVTTHVNTYTVPAGNYKNADMGEVHSYRYVDAENVYKAGYTEGLAEGQSGNVDANAVFVVRQTHDYYCYPLATSTYSQGEIADYQVTHEDGAIGHTQGCYVQYKCNVCGYVFKVSRAGSGMQHTIKSQALNNYNAHLTNGHCTGKKEKNGKYHVDIACGKNEGEQEITNTSLLGEGDDIVRVTITY